MHSIGFGTFLVFALLVWFTVSADIRAHRGGGVLTLADAGKWSMVYIGSAMVFALYLAVMHGGDATSAFLAGYTMEKALSVDNLLVFGAVFAYFGIQPDFRRRILYYGVFGAMFFRMLFVTIGAGSLWLFGRPVEFIFGAVVALSAWKLLQGGDEPGEIDHNSRWYIRWAKDWFPVTPDATQNRFFDGMLRATPLLLCLIAVEVTDVMFSFDSVPAVISVTKQPVLIYAAMVFAILGLRSLYFVLEALTKYLAHLGSAVAVVLAFVAAKLMAHAIFGLEVNPGLSLAIILLVLGGGVAASFVFPKSECASD